MYDEGRVPGVPDSTQIARGGTETAHSGGRRAARVSVNDCE